MNDREYGGFLPFETAMCNAGNEYFYQYKANKIDVDSGRSGLQFIIEEFSFKRIWLPIYNCSKIYHRISRSCNIGINYYNLDSNFYPIMDFSKVEEGDVLLWINYFGLMSCDIISKVVDLQLKFDLKIIIDNSQAYFSTPQMEVFNLYSCRKFIGVPDGGHVIGKAICSKELPTYNTAENYLYLLTNLEQGQREAYKKYRVSEERFNDSIHAYGMPMLTKMFLTRIDYRRIIEKRKENLLKLHSELGGKNNLKFDFVSDTAMIYPYVTHDKSLQSLIIEKHLLNYGLWKHVPNIDGANEFEKRMSDYIIPLPIDQRYDEKDMERLIEIIKYYKA